MFHDQTETQSPDKVSKPKIKEAGILAVQGPSSQKGAPKEQNDGLKHQKRYQLHKALALCQSAHSLPDPVWIIRCVAKKCDHAFL